MNSTALPSLTPAQIHGLMAIFGNPICGYAKVRPAVFKRLVDRGLVKRVEGAFRSGCLGSNSAVLPTKAGFGIIARHLPPTLGEVTAALEGGADAKDVARRLRFWGKVDDHFPRTAVFGLAA